MRKLFFVCLVAVVALCSCGERYEEYEMRGVVYTDSTRTETVSGAELLFFETDGDASPWVHEFKALGSARSDRNGRWAFGYVHNMENPYGNGAKFKFERTPWMLLITSGEDTLYWSNAGRTDTMEVWPIKSRWDDSTGAFIGYF
ncbi:MAG: hypothetical protein K5867_11280 [Bacteroidales bacterium]|nr:hypothetical protein [Bacteroidales bacterium]